MSDKTKRDDSHCYRCGDFCLYLDRVKALAGGYHAILCADCLTDWDEYIRTTPEWTEHVRIGDDLQTLFGQVFSDGVRRDNELAAVRLQEAALHKELRVVAETWTTDRIEREKPEAPPPLTPEELEEQRLKHIARLEARLVSLKAVGEKEPAS